MKDICQVIASGIKWVISLRLVDMEDISQVIANEITWVISLRLIDMEDISQMIASGIEMSDITKISATILALSLFL